MNMNKIAMLVYVMAAPVLAGVFVTALLSMGKTGYLLLLSAGLAGFIAAIPAALYVGRQIGKGRKA
jgi:hypothetical protein